MDLSGAPTDTATDAQPKIYEYWPDRLVKTVTIRTLEGWREQLEDKARSLREDLAKVDGGVVQINSEFERRDAERRRRTAVSPQEGAAATRSEETAP